MLGTMDCPSGAWSFDSCVSLPPSLSPWETFSSACSTTLHRDGCRSAPGGSQVGYRGRERLHLLLLSTPSGHLAMRGGGKVAAVLLCRQHCQ